MDRRTTKFVVRVFNPNIDPSVAENLKAEQVKDPTVSAINCPSRLGMVETPKGTFWLDPEGCGGAKPLEEEGCSLEFHREHIRDGKGSFECIPFAKSIYSLAECKACATGELISLERFIGSGHRKDANFEDWFTALSKADTI